jgi:predicted O-methyltransferase YrrM
MPEFSDDWFSTNIPQWQSLFAGIGWNADEPKTAVEIGSYEGRSALWTLENLLRHPNSILHCIDTFEGGVEHGPQHTARLLERFSRNVHGSPHGSKVRVHAAHSIDALIVLASQGLNADFVYIDGSHQAPDVLADLVLAFKVLRPGGVLICDDYLWSNEPQGQADVLNSPKIAIDAFTTIYRRKLAFAVQRNWQFACIKTED